MGGALQSVIDALNEPFWGDLVRGGYGRFGGPKTLKTPILAVFRGRWARQDSNL